MIYSYSDVHYKMIFIQKNLFSPFLPSYYFPSPILLWVLFDHPDCLVMFPYIWTLIFILTSGFNQTI
jgi:hypothetical protein